MKFIDFVNENLSRTRVVTSFISYPIDSVRRWGENRLSYFLKDLSFSTKEETSTDINSYTDTNTNKNHFISEPNLQSDISDELLTVGEKYGDDLDLSRGDIYTIIEILKKNRNESLYIAENSNQDKVFIKEYKLVNSNSEINEEIKRDFKNIIDFNLRIGREYDFRILTLIDRFTRDRSCFLITKYIAGAVPLKDYLGKNPVITNEQIKVIIQQVLESLLFLHTTYRAKFQTDKQEIQKGISHGNINLNSLLIKDIKETGVQNERRFFIYLTDLALWENIFYPNKVYSNSQNKNLTQNGEYLSDKSQDLFNLGKLALALISGRYDEQSWQIIDSEADNILPKTHNIKFSAFIRHLLNKEHSLKAEEALDEITKINVKQDNTHIPSAPTPNNQSVEQKTEEATKTPNFLLPLLACSSLFLLLIGFGIFGIINSRKPQQSISNSTSNQDNKNCCLLTEKDFEGIQGKYLVESVWERVNQQLFYDASSQSTSLMNLLSKRGLKSTYFLEVKKDIKLKQQQIRKDKDYDRAAIVNKLIGGDINFALMRLPENASKDFGTSGLTQSKAVAYDALVIFVAFKYSLGADDTPAKILDGKITKQEISELYTNKQIQRITSKNYKTILYFPEDKETQTIFKEQISKIIADTKNITSRIEVDNIKSDLNKTINNNNQFLSDNLFQKVRDDSLSDKSNSNTIVIGVDRLSRLFGQCSVYPLAIVDDNNQPIQLLKQLNGEDIQPNDINLDLCSDKGTYFQNVEALSSGKYPLSYQLGVVYNKETNKQQGEEFAQALRKYEAQYLLSQVGLVPVEPIPNLHKYFSGEITNDR